MPWIDLTLLLAIGALAGLLAGLLGVGGGLVVVPALLWVLPHQGVAPADALHVAVATSLAAICLTALSSAHAHHRRGAVEWSWVIWLTPGLLLGAAGGARWVASWSSGFLAWFVAGFCVLAAWQLLRAPKTVVAGAVARQPDARWLLPGGVVIGMVSAAVGIGGGSLTVPLLHMRGAALRSAIATSAACGFPIALAGTLGYASSAREVSGLSSWSLGLIDFRLALLLGALAVLLAPWGARLAHRLPVPRLKRGFALWLMAVAAFLAYKAARGS